MEVRGTGRRHTTATSSLRASRVKGAKAAGDTWWRGRAATNGAAAALGAAGWEPRGGEASPRSAGAPHRRLAGID
jgi:hypothetical protein